ncbi:hypothetical protein [uncultured Aquimarina sp.]|uniref:hypothetical protein n=1 Tax=uncultured Aquimarina sp. TaxID=575652 RepID=UPI00262ED4D9|nr:hypothetical protein [uncultured Aquimarina sp.]
MWDSKPWDNDRAADWFAKLMEQTDLPSKVRKTLLLHKEKDPYGDNTPILRSAVYCVLQFCRVYVWPINDLDNDLALAIDATKKILTDQEYCYSDEIVDEINAELLELKQRLKT